MQTNETGVTHRTYIHKAYVTIWSYRSTWRSCPCTSSLVAADEHFYRKESGYQLEETARSSQENMDFSDSVWYCNVTTRLLGCLHSSWPWKRDATVSEDYALMMAVQALSTCVAVGWVLRIQSSEFGPVETVLTLCQFSCVCWLIASGNWGNNEVRVILDYCCDGIWVTDQYLRLILWTLCRAIIVSDLYNITISIFDWLKLSKPLRTSASLFMTVYCVYHLRRHRHRLYIHVHTYIAIEQYHHFLYL